CQQGNSIPVTF
nr:immunoglobulin light chain junction region [Macaca mulatta]MOX53025.1 immunoglobulin light chain junction region [Macaca mulatta]MOX53293.1 immunoglobulin light chain junction region [Macaca mulatta]MOX53524.1 immunoglobulin light chain junction region [Macaca mulatta]MOX57004.1 immunoglobulin light chain junction region [Macaca mulatta]